MFANHSNTGYWFFLLSNINGYLAFLQIRCSFCCPNLLCTRINQFILLREITWMWEDLSMESSHRKELITSSLSFRPSPDFLFWLYNSTGTGPRQVAMLYKMPYQELSNPEKTGQIHGNELTRQACACYTILVRRSFDRPFSFHIVSRSVERNTACRPGTHKRTS